MPRAVCLGEILIDCFAEQPGLARSEVTSWAPLPGGAPANVACGLVKLGSEADFIGAVGNDHWGDALMTLLADMGVGCQGVQRRRKAPTRQVYVICNETDEGSEERFCHPVFAGFSESDPTVFADAHLFADALDLDRVLADFLVLGTLSLAYDDTRQSVECALGLATAQEIPVLVDVNWRPMFWPQPTAAPGRIYDLISKAQFLKASEEEAEWLFGTTSPAAIAQQLPHLKGVLVTAGAGGCEYWLMGNAGAVPGFIVDVEETLGASDAFTAGFVHQLLQKGTCCIEAAESARNVVMYASAVGALTTTRPGAIAALPSAKEVEVFLYLNAKSLG
ncbi:MAG: carbohydrate kinase [Phormidesmis sp.]